MYHRPQNKSPAKSSKKYNSLSTGNRFLDNGKITLIVAPALKEARAALSFTSRRVTAKYNHQQKVTHHHKYIDATLIRHQNKTKKNNSFLHIL
jgi:hypothetical protein